MDYEASLQRALDAVPDIGGDDERLAVPDARAQRDGAFTRLANLEAIADALAREPDHLHRAIQRTLGTSGSLDAGVGRYSGTFSAEDFEDAVAEYVAEYVTCSECGLPDTRLVSEDRTTMLRCDACGAFRPVAKRRTTTTASEEPTLQEGGTYDVRITGTGRKGDGVAEKGKYTIFVPGTSEGDEVTIYVESIKGNLAFARLAG